MRDEHPIVEFYRCGKRLYEGAAPAKKIDSLRPRDVVVLGGPVKINKVDLQTKLRSNAGKQN